MEAKDLMLFLCWDEESEETEDCTMLSNKHETKEDGNSRKRHKRDLLLLRRTIGGNGSIIICLNPHPLQQNSLSSKIHVRTISYPSDNSEPFQFLIASFILRKDHSNSSAQHQEESSEDTDDDESSQGDDDKKKKKEKKEKKDKKKGKASKKGKGSKGKDKKKKKKKGKETEKQKEARLAREAAKEKKREEREKEREEKKEQQEKVKDAKKVLCGGCT